MRILSTISVFFLLLLSGCTYTPENGQNIDTLIQSRFDQKIVYTQGADEAAIRQHCQNKNGTFDPCGNSCAPDAEVCTTVCVPVCQFESSQDSDTKKDTAENSTHGVNNTPLPLSVPEGMKLDIWADNLDGVRDIEGPDGLGNYWVSRTDQGVITLITTNDHGGVENIDDIFRGLKNPHGLLIDPYNPTVLYFTEEEALKRVQLYTEDTPEVLAEFPEGDRHFTRTLHWGPDDKIYISIGSSCDTCIEENDLYATVYRMNPDGSEFELFAEGLRNAVFFATEPIFGDIWVTEMGRDYLGDTLPPDEINILQQDAHYGWPYCYGDQIFDTEFASEHDKEASFCEETKAPVFNLPAHVAPLGLTFIPEEGWPAEYRLDLLVALHGSWNRSNKVGYKVARISLNDQARPEGEMQDFLSGWLTEEGNVLGRPVDLLAQPGGILYITDDDRGVIYRLTTLSSDMNGDDGNGEDQPNDPVSTDMIRVANPLPNQQISSPLTVSGKARGPWYFEASFPLELQDGNGNRIIRTSVQAEGEWMTEDFVPFETSLEFERPETDTGMLILEKSNPSGLPENAESIEIPVRFFDGK
ncbi:PQQ-dependent sugar dehydrogenase [Candidatus Gracilibacteria bacterium]|nr:PQQ-dependent sugar dehydrogenase [Candidatus Gracilibacteria bacterium]MCF7819246.1 PQQ-dependent sugar dehydrogenase [Candidatus Gracilibacteria bacterium]